MLDEDLIKKNQDEIVETPKSRGPKKKAKVNPK